MIKVLNLASVPHYFDKVFESIYREWGEQNPNFWKSWIKSSMKERGVPSTYVVLSEEKYVGTFSIWNCDLQSRQDLFPWIGGIVVEPTFRGHGLGLYIQEEIKRILITEGIKQAYLFTEHKGFYEKTGWVYIEEIYDEKDHKVLLYKLCL